MRARIQLVSLAALAFVLGRLTAQPDPAEVLKEADRAFDLASAKGGAAAWASFFAEDGRMFTPRGIVTGRKAIEDLMAPAFRPGSSLRWKPLTAEIAASRDLGYTTGESIRLFTDDQGRKMQGTGRYVTIWRKQKDGTWKVALDTGSGEPPKPVAP